MSVFIYPPQDNKGNIVLKFRSIRESFICAKENSDKQNGSSVYNSSDDEWTDNYLFNEFIDDFFLLKNKNEKQDKIKKITKSLMEVMDNYKHKLIPSNIFPESYDVCGSSIDMGRYMDNDPHCMSNFLDTKPNKNVNLFFNAGNRAYYSGEIELVGMIIFCILNILKNRMINVYLYTNTDNKLFVFIPVIKTGATVIVPQVELILLNLKAYFRRVKFAILEGLPPSIRGKHGIYKSRGYGSAENSNKEEIEKIYGIRPDILINKLDSTNIDDVCKAVVEKIVESLI